MSDALPTRQLSRATLASTVHARLRSDILEGALEPGGRLRVEFVCERYRAGASPVREALNRLASEGLVDRHDQRGFAVAPVSLADLRELVKTRCWVEGMALRQSIQDRTEAWEETIVLAFHRLSRIPRSTGSEHFAANPDWEQVHRSFHTALIAGCGSVPLLRFCEDLRDRADRYRQIAAAAEFPRRNELDEHRTIMELTISDDAANAVEMLEQHYRRTASACENYFLSRDAKGEPYRSHARNVGEPEQAG